MVAGSNAEAMLARLRALVIARPALSQLLVQSARSFNQRVFGRTLSAGEFLEIYIEEARSLFQLMESRLKPGMRVLEIGGGLGIFHVMAHAEGAEIVSVEPSGGGSSFVHSASHRSASSPDTRNSSSMPALNAWTGRTMSLIL